MRKSRIGYDRVDCGGVKVLAHGAGISGVDDQTVVVLAVHFFSVATCSVGGSSTHVETHSVHVRKHRHCLEKNGTQTTKGIHYE